MPTHAPMMKEISATMQSFRRDVVALDTPDHIDPGEVFASQNQTCVVRGALDSVGIGYSVRMAKAPFIILMPGRTGSSLLVSCLSKHPNILVEGERLVPLLEANEQMSWMSSFYSRSRFRVRAWGRSVAALLGALGWKKS